MYPSLVVGFGNALLETVYFGLPTLVNRYDVPAADIAPKGFRFVEIYGVVSDGAVSGVADIRARPDRAKAMAAHNCDVARRHYSYEALDDLLSGVGL